MKIYIERIHIRAHHGVLEQEHQVGHDFLVSVEATTDDERSTVSDNIAHTVSYADMAEAVRQEMVQSSQLLEHVAGRIARRLLADHPSLSSVRVRLTKQAPPIAGLQCDGAGVEVTLSS